MNRLPFNARLMCGVFLCIAINATCAAGPVAVSVQPAAHRHQALQVQLTALAQRALPGQIGIAVMDPRTGEEWGVNQNTPFPLMSVFKAPVAAAVLAQVDAGLYQLNQTVSLSPTDFVEGSAVPSVGDALQAGRTTFELRELLFGAVAQSDNTSVDALIRLLGGPARVTAYLRSKHITGMHIEIDERGFEYEARNLAPGQELPENETAEQTLARKKAGYAAVLADQRNQSTPVAAIDFLNKLNREQLLSPSSTDLLIAMMRKQTLPSRLRGGLPAGFELADKCGTTSSVDGRTAVWNDIGIVTGPDGRQLMIAVFLKDSRASREARDQLIADVAKTAIAGVYRSN